MNVKAFPLKYILFVVLKVMIPILLMMIYLSGYAREPEYREEELKLIAFPDDNKSSSNEDENDINFHIQQNLHWCISSHYTGISALHCVNRSNMSYEMWVASLKLK